MVTSSKLMPVIYRDLTIPLSGVQLGLLASRVLGISVCSNRSYTHNPGQGKATADTQYAETSGIDRRSAR